MKIASNNKNSARVQTRQMRPVARRGSGIKFRKTITINRLVPEVYSFGRRLENLPLFMKHLKSVKGNGGNISHWIANLGGTRFEWDAETIEVRPCEMISWKSLPAAEVDHAGSISFRPASGNHGTVVKISLNYAPPGRKAKPKVLKIFGKNLRPKIKDDLSQFKSLMEAEENSMIPSYGITGDKVSIPS